MNIFSNVECNINHKDKVNSWLSSNIQSFKKRNNDEYNEEYNHTSLPQEKKGDWGLHARISKKHAIVFKKWLDICSIHGKYRDVWEKTMNECYKNGILDEKAWKHFEIMSNIPSNVLKTWLHVPVDISNASTNEIMGIFYKYHEENNINDFCLKKTLS